MHLQVALAPPTILIDADSKAKLWACCERAVGEFVVGPPAPEPQPDPGDPS